MTLLTSCRVVSRAGIFGPVRPGSGFSLSKYFGPISGLLSKFCYNIKSNDLFISWRIFVLLTEVTSVSEVIVIFLQLILFANTAALFYSLLGLVSHCFWEDDNREEISTRWHCVEKITHVILDLFGEAYNPVFQIYKAILESFFYVYSAIVDSFVKVYFFLEKHYNPHSAALSLTKMLRLCQIMSMFCSRWL